MPCYLCIARGKKKKKTDAERHRFSDQPPTAEYVLCLRKNEKRKVNTHTHTYKTCPVCVSVAREITEKPAQFTQKLCTLHWPGPLKVNYIYFIFGGGEVNTNLREWLLWRELDINRRSFTVVGFKWKSFFFFFSFFLEIPGGQLLCLMYETLSCFPSSGFRK